MISSLSIADFLTSRQSRQASLIDVRAPLEFYKGHLPFAVNIPLFDDEERKQIGILYKQAGRDQAVLRGLDLVGPKMGNLVRAVNKLTPDNGLFVHCWRGGMRSESMAWLWHMAGYEVFVLHGGYKAFRSLVHQRFAHPLPLIKIGGKTGSGKTDILKELAALGEQVIDLEGLACHKGSAFGALGQPEQPQVEQFENDLYQVISQLDPKRRIWIEDESHAIGRVYMPQGIWQQMKMAPMLVVDMPLERRIDRLLREYGSFDSEQIGSSLEKIQKRLGGQYLKVAREALIQKDYASLARIVLRYYDKAYEHSLSKKTIIHRLAIEKDNPGDNAKRLLEYHQNTFSLHDRSKHH